MRKLKIVIPTMPFDFDVYSEISNKYKNAEITESFYKSISITPGQPDDLKIWLKVCAYRKGFTFNLEAIFGTQRLCFNIGNFSYTGKDTDCYLPLGDIDTFQEIYESQVVDKIIERLYDIIGMKKDKYGFQFVTRKDLLMLVKYEEGKRG